MTLAADVAGIVGTGYDELLGRGRSVVTRIRRQKSTKDLQRQASTTVRRSKATVTTAKKGAATPAARPRAPRRRPGSRRPQPAPPQGTATTAKKRAAATKKTAKSATTSARKTTATARRPLLPRRRRSVADPPLRRNTAAPAPPEAPFGGAAAAFGRPPAGRGFVALGSAPCSTISGIPARSRRLSITGLIALVIWVALLGVKIFAFVDSLRYSNNHYVSAGKRSRTLWLVLTGLSLAFHLISDVLPRQHRRHHRLDRLPRRRAPRAPAGDRPRRQPEQHGSLRAVVTAAMSEDTHGRTHRLELDDQSLREWDAIVLDSSPDGIVLDRSAFYPGGGGQPPDHGVLLWGGVQTRIVGVRKGDDLESDAGRGRPHPAYRHRCPRRGRGRAAYGADAHPLGSAPALGGRVPRLRLARHRRQHGAARGADGLQPPRGARGLQGPCRRGVRGRGRRRPGDRGHQLAARRGVLDASRPDPDRDEPAAARPRGRAHRRHRRSRHPGRWRHPRRVDRQIGRIEVVKVENKGKGFRRLRIRLVDGS